ncbi:MAG: hypothetical protein EBX04_07820 [Rhodobacteraceae bacterium]|nr:hypothetical protein [Paracoccaceae bacterium]
MPMLNGKNTTQDEVAHMRTLFQQHPAITRDVKNIENGIVTTTLSDDPKVADALINHVAEMITRVSRSKARPCPSDLNRALALKQRSRLWKTV